MASKWSPQSGFSSFFYRYPNYRYGYGHLNGYGYYGHPYGLGYRGYGHYGKRSASRHPQPKSVAPYLHYDLGRKLGYFAYRGYPQVWSYTRLQKQKSVDSEAA